MDKEGINKDEDILSSPKEDLSSHSLKKNEGADASKEDLKDQGEYSEGEEEEHDKEGDARFIPISDASEKLNVPPHVLRFWEVKFPEVSPLKRRGGRRFYRSDDIKLLAEIRDLLYKEGYTIKGVQKLLKEAVQQKKKQTSDSLKPESSIVVCNRSDIKSVCDDLKDVVEIMKRMT